MGQRWARFKAMVLLRCPNCLRGRVFSGAVQMNEHCPFCGIRFAREPGYFLGAMYISYPLAAIVLGVLALALLLTFLYPKAAPATVQTAVAFVSGLLIAGLGFWLLLRRLSGAADHIHIGGHGHHHHQRRQPVRWRRRQHGQPRHRQRHRQRRTALRPQQ